MNYEVFPFGKYKGVKLNELPSTYIVLALESFALPVELSDELYRIMLGRMGVYSLIDKTLSEMVSSNGHEVTAFYEFKSLNNQRKEEYENKRV